MQQILFEDRKALPDESGRPRAPALKAVPNSMRFSDEQILALSHAVLMIKPPHAEGGLTVSDAPTQLVDIFPTILDILPLPEPDHRIHGESVYRIGDGNRTREARVALDPWERYGDKLIELKIEDQTDLIRSGLSVLGPATDARLWREEVRRQEAAAVSD